MDKTSDLFRENLKALRNEKKLTQKSLSERLGFESNVVETYEGGRRFPEPEVIDQLAKEFKVSPSYFFLKPGEIPEPTPKKALEIIAREIEKPLAAIPLVNPLDGLDPNDITIILNHINAIKSRKRIKPVKALKNKT